MSLLECLLCASEKAANIARKCRQEKQLFELLVQEKKSDEANPRFVQDFKTLADVLIQQTVKHDVGNVFPELRENIRGEESNLFSNKLGETIFVDVLDTAEITGKLLETVLDGNVQAAELLSEEVHKTIELKDINTKLPKKHEFDFDYSQLAVWIDPIDSTAEYISGKDVGERNGIHLSGLRCVTVLIGVFNRTTGEPIMGVVNQPFYSQEDNEWIGKCYWGYNITGKCDNSFVSSFSSQSNIICLSSSEDDDIKSKLAENGFNLVETAGAGYKLLSVITGEACAYILSKNSTFKWDTCGPQAIFRSLGGNILTYKWSRIGSFVPLNYFDNEGCLQIEKCCNEGGLVAYTDETQANKILTILGKTEH